MCAIRSARELGPREDNYNLTTDVAHPPGQTSRWERYTERNAERARYITERAHFVGNLDVEPSQMNREEVTLAVQAMYISN